MADDNNRPQRAIERVHEADIPVIYANSIELGISVYDVMIVLGQTLRQDATMAVINQVARVMLSPQHAKVLAKLLVDKLADYEAKYGTIPSAPPEDVIVETTGQPQLAEQSLAAAPKSGSRRVPHRP